MHERVVKERIISSEYNLTITMEYASEIFVEMPDGTLSLGLRAYIPHRSWPLLLIPQPHPDLLLF
jgi:hypothetical protein